MKTAMIDEQRADAHVVVYGDAGAITEREWQCARMMQEWYGLPLVIERDDTVFFAGHAESGVGIVRDARREAVAECFERLRATIVDAIEDDDVDADAIVRAILAGEP